jgi:hypothetical protein
VRLIEERGLASRVIVAEDSIADDDGQPVQKSKLELDPVWA